MKNIISTLRAQKLIQCPDYVESQTHYLAIGGSRAYGCSNLDSDYDIVGFALPPANITFPHSQNLIYGFDKYPKFDQWEAKDIEWNKKQYSFNVYGIVRFFGLCAECNPNIVEMLFIHEENILKMSSIAVIVRESRRDFLHKGAYHRFKSYACAQWSKMTTNKSETSSRARHPVDYYDLKFGTHLVRLLLQCEQILTEHDMDLFRNKEQLKSIRRGEWTLQQLNDWFHQKVIDLEKMFAESTLQHDIDRSKIKTLLLKCLEHGYGSIDKWIVDVNKYQLAVQEIKEIVGKL